MLQQVNAYNTYRKINSTALSLLRIVPATAIYDAIFYEATENSQTVKRFRALVWKMDSYLRTLHEVPATLPGGQSFMLDDNSFAGIVLNVTRIIDIYSTKIYVVRGTLNMDNNATDDAKFRALMDGIIDSSYQIEQEITLVPNIYEDSNKWMRIALPQILIPVKVFPSSIVNAQISYSFAFSTAQFSTEPPDSTPRMIFIA